MPFPNTKTGIQNRQMGRNSFGALFLAGKQSASTIVYSIAQGATSNITAISIQMSDKNGNPVAGIQAFDIWLSDAATGIGLTATTASGGFAAGASGTILGTLTTSKAIRAITDANGLFILNITDTAKTLFYAVAAIPVNGSVWVSRKLVAGDYK